MQYILAFFLLRYDEIQIPLVLEKIIPKISEHRELTSFLFGDENTINFLDFKKLSVFVTYVTIEFYIFGK